MEDVSGSSSSDMGAISLLDMLWLKGRDKKAECKVKNYMMITIPEVWIIYQSAVSFFNVGTNQRVDSVKTAELGAVNDMDEWNFFSMLGNEKTTV